MTLSDQQFISALRSALHYLYEPDQLRRSPLIAFFDLASRVDAALALQQILLNAIQGLKPGDDDPPQSHAWRLYDLLYFRYVRGYERIEVANQLGISDRQLVREQKNAIHALFLRLWQARAPETEETQESVWGKMVPDEKPSHWKPVLVSVLELLRPLARAQETQVRLEALEDAPDQFVPPVTLRHSLLTVLGEMIPLAHGKELVLTPGVEDQALVISARIAGPVTDAVALEPGIEAARLLIERVGGSLRLVSSRSPVEVRLVLPLLPQIQVLMIDDNADIIHLFQRYVQGTRFSVVGLQDPTAVAEWIEKIDPRIILLDVMMPGLDGWDLLTQLRLKHQLNRSAVLVCSILPQERLAISLGADGFLQKPVLPQNFLSALDEQLARLEARPAREEDTP